MATVPGRRIPMSKLSKMESELIMLLRRHPDPMAAFLTAVQIITDHLEGEGEHNYV